MGRSHASILGPAVAAVVGAGIGAAVPASAAVTPVKVISDCLTAHYKPSTITVFCGDGGGYLTHAHWKTWTTRSATGTALFSVNACVPDCADGHFHNYPAKVALESPSGNPRVWHRLVVHFTAGHPAGFGSVFRFKIYPGA